MASEAQIEKYMKSLEISREEAIQLIADDAKVDRMNVKEAESDMTAEQKQAAKIARKSDRKPTVYKFDTSKRAKKENSGKRALIDTIKIALENVGCENIEVTNAEREMVFFSDGVKYKVVLSAPRS